MLWCIIKRGKGCLYLPDVKSRDNSSILHLVAASYLVASTLIGHQFFMRLDNDSVKVFNEAVLLFDHKTILAISNRKYRK